jgi:DnaD/phage-associated family protein
MWPWFIKEFDDWGRMTGSPLKIKLQVFQAFPFTVSDILQAISLFSVNGLVHVYDINGNKYLAVNPDTFYKHQPYIHKSKRVEDKSSIPAPVDAPWNKTPRDVAEVSGESREIVPSPSPSPSPSQDHNNDDPAREVQEIVKTYEQEFGRLMSPSESGQLCAYLDEGLSGEVICEAIKRTRLQGKTNVSYTKTILNGWHTQGVKNMAGVALADEEFEKRKTKGQPRAPDKPTDPEREKRRALAKTLYV